MEEKVMKSRLKSIKCVTVLLMILFAMILSTCGGGRDDGGGDTGQYEAEEIIGPEGGVVEVTDPESPIYGAKIEIPEGVLDERLTITIAKTTKIAPAPETFNFGEYINFGPSGITFNGDVTCVIPYTDSDDDGILDGTDILEINLSVYTYANNSKSWNKVPVINQDLSNNLLFIETGHFSQYVASIFYDSNYVWPVYINENALVYDVLPDYENSCEVDSACWDAFSLGISAVLSRFLGPFAIPIDFIMAIPVVGGGSDPANYAEVSLFFDSDQIVKGDSVYNDFNHISSTIAYPLIRIETGLCGTANAMKILVYEYDSQVCISLYEQEVLSEIEMSTYLPRFIVLRNPIDFCSFRTQLGSNSFFQVTSPPPSGEDWCSVIAEVSDVTIQKFGLVCEGPATHQDDFEDGIIDTGLWVVGGQKGGWNGCGNGDGQWFNEEIAGADGYLQARVTTPESANTYGSDSWMRTVYDFNDGNDWIINFRWEPDIQTVGQWHADHHVIEITDGRTDWIDCVYHTPSSKVLPGTLQLYFAIGQDFGPTTWSIVINASASEATLYEGPNGIGPIHSTKELDNGGTWYVRFITATATSAGYTAKDCRLNLYDFTATGYSPEPVTPNIYLTFEHFILGIEARPGYHGVGGLALSPDESLLYAAHWQAGTVQSDDPIGVYLTADNSFFDQTVVGPCVGNVVTSNDGRYVYAPEYYGGYIHRYDTWDNNAKSSIPLGSWAENVWKSPNGERIIVHYNSASGNPSSNHSLALIDIAGDNFSKIDSFNTGRPIAKLSAAFSDDGQHIYLAAGSSDTGGPTLIDVGINGSFQIDRELELTVAANQKMAGVARSRGTLFVGDWSGGKLHVVDIDEDTFEKSGEVPLSGNPTNIAIHPDQRHLFIMYDSGTLSILDLWTMTEVFSLPGLNLGLLDAVFTADGRKVYVSHGHQTEGGFSVIAIH